MQNAGQSCIAAKRFLVHENIATDFISRFTKAVQELKQAMLLDLNTQIGSFARVDLAEELELQVQKIDSNGSKTNFRRKQKRAFTNLLF